MQVHHSAVVLCMAANRCRHEHVQTHLVEAAMLIWVKSRGIIEVVRSRSSERAHSGRLLKELMYPTLSCTAIS